MPQLLNILESHRRQLFVGRQHELAEVSTLLSPESGQRLFFFVGAGGQGKTTLLSEIEDRARKEGHFVARLDARHYQGEPQRFALDAFGVLPQAGPGLANIPPLLLVDSFEYLSPVENWFHSSFLPRLDSSIRLIIAGRQPPGPRWRADLGWVPLMQVLDLANFSQSETQAYLTKRTVDRTAWSPLWRISQGNPLILALATEISEQLGPAALTDRAGKDRLQRLMLDFVQETLTNDQAHALQAAAIVQTLSQPLLTAMLPDTDTEALYDWLARLSFMNVAEQGLFPHDLIRDAICTDLRRRNPDWRETLTRRAETFYATRLGQDTVTPPEDIIAAISYLSRHGAAPAILIDLHEANPVYADTPVKSDIQDTRALVAKHQGSAQLALFDFWYGRHPEELVVLRDRDQALAGFFMFVDFEKLSEHEIKRDPVIATYYDFMTKLDISHPYKASLCRFWLDRDHNLAPSSVQAVVFHQIIGRAARKRLMVCGVIQADDHVTRTLADVAEHHVIPLEIRFPDGSAPLLTLHDWSSESIPTWMIRTNRRVRGLSGADPTLPEPEEFKRELKKALRYFTRPNQLRRNRLLQFCTAPLDGNRAEKEAIDILRAEIIEASKQLRVSPRTARYDDVIQRSYLQPATSQLAAAEALGMAPSTYYRQLAAAIDVLADTLRQRLASRSSGHG